MELWVFFAGLSALGWSFVSLLDKFVVESEIDDTLATGSLHALFNCLTVAGLSVTIGGLNFSFSFLGIGIILGGL